MMLAQQALRQVHEYQRSPVFIGRVPLAPKAEMIPTRLSQ